MSDGPVQVLVLGFDEPHFDGTVLAELTRLGEAGVVRLTDLLVVRRADDGSLETVDLDGRGELAAALLGGADAGGSDAGGSDAGGSDAGGSDESVAQTWSLADVVPERGVAVVALIEHLWAVPLSSALRSAGATVLEETWLSEDDRALLASMGR